MDPVSQVGLTGQRGGCRATPGVWMPRPPAPSSCSLSLFLSLSRLLGPQLASAGTFRALKEPLAFLRALELVSSGLCAGRNPQVRRGRVGCSRFGSAPSLGGQPLPSILPTPQVPFQDGGDRMEGSGLEAGAWTNFCRRLDEESSLRRAGAEERSLLGRPGGAQMQALPLGFGCTPAFRGAEGVRGGTWGRAK